MKKHPSQTKAAMRVRIQYAHDHTCFLSWEENGFLYFAYQPIEVAG